jgi:hypothetical protein
MNTVYASITGRIVMALDGDSFLPDAEDCAEAWRQMR